MIEDHVRDSLRMAGIGKVYHDRTLAEVPELEDVRKSIIEGTAAASIADGKAWTIVGSSLKAREAFMILARSLHIAGSGVIITDASNLVERMDGLERMPRIICCTGFIEPGPTIFERWQRRAVETLLEDWFEEGGAFIPLFCDQPTTAHEWWSHSLVEDIMRRNKIITIGPMRQKARPPVEGGQRRART